MRDSERSLRVQILATEHWGLLAARSTTQSEVLSRISMFLTLVSAGLVSLALVGNATQFADPFPMFAIAVLTVVNLVGLLTQVRVKNASMDDLMFVLAMNRLRGTYAELDAGVAPSFMASPFDDEAGIGVTYYFLKPGRSGFSQVAGSSMIFIIAVNATLLGLLAAIIASFAGAALWFAAAVGGVIAVAYFVISIARGAASFSGVWQHHEPLHPSPRA